LGENDKLKHIGQLERRIPMPEMTIRRFSVFSVAKIYGLIFFVVGLLIGLVYGLSVMLFGAAFAAMAPSNDGATFGGVGSVVIGLLVLIFFPIVYSVAGFIGGTISALVYNMAAGVAGGIRFELESAAVDYAPPAANQWNQNPYPAQ
jgi:hypothetical protein